MSIDERFSLAEFRVAGSGTSAARRLADNLEQEVERRLHDVTIKAFEEIVADLNRLGHNLKEYTPLVPGDIAFRDDEELNSGYLCRLRLGVDTVTSVGFGDTKDHYDENKP